MSILASRPVLRLPSRRALALALAAIVGLVALLLPSARAMAQQTRTRSGVVEVALMLRRLDGVKRILVVGAHPDDEDTALLAEMDRRRGARAAYLSLTRGEGGQNLIGPELGTGLGLIRTGELLAARRLDGAEQYFSRAYDFGYSKTARETFRHWPRDSLLSDVVWVIRSFRPHVVVSVFSGTPADGHGQHQAAGMVAREAFDAAGDSTRFPEHMDMGVRPWEPLKLYRRAWRDPDRATLRVSTGRYDPLLGRSAFQLAMESRSQHRSQDFGVAEPPGPRYTRLLRLRDRTGAAADDPLFAGVDTTLAGLVSGWPPRARERARRHIRDYREAIREAGDSLRALEPGASVAPLSAALSAVTAARRLAAEMAPPGGEARRVLARREGLVGRALSTARGLRLRFRAEDDSWVPGQATRVHAELWNGGGGAVRAGPPALDFNGGSWSVRLLSADSVTTSPQERSRFYGAGPPVKGGRGAVQIPPGRVARWTLRITVPADARPSEPYFLRRDTVGDFYRWPRDPELRGRPLDPPVAVGRMPVRLVPGDASRRSVSYELGGPVRYRGVDKAEGEFWDPVYVVSPLSVGVEPRVLVWPVEAPDSRPATDRTDRGRRLGVALRSQVEGTVRADVELRLPAGWFARPATARVRLDGRGAEASREFRLGRRDVSADAPARTTTAARTTYTVRATADVVSFTEAGARTSPDPGGADEGRGGGRGGSARRTHGRELTMIEYPHIEPVPFYRDAEARVERFPVSVTGGRRVGYVMGSGDDVPGAIRQLGLPVEMLGPGRVRGGKFGDLDVIVLGVRAYEVREDLQAANARLLEWVREGGTLVVQYNKYEFVEGDFAPFEATMAHPHDRVTDERAPVKLLHPDAPVLSTPNRIASRDFRGWIQERGLYFLHEWGEAFTPLLAVADPGEEPARGSLLVAPLGDGLYVYTGLAFFRQLPAGVPGAYRLFANLLSLEPAAWRRWLRSGAPAGDRR